MNDHSPPIQSQVDQAVLDYLDELLRSPEDEKKASQLASSHAKKTESELQKADRPKNDSQQSDEKQAIVAGKDLAPDLSDKQDTSSESGAYKLQQSTTPVAGVAFEPNVKANRLSALDWKEPADVARKLNIRLKAPPAPQPLSVKENALPSSPQNELAEPKPQRQSIARRRLAERRRKQKLQAENATPEAAPKVVAKTSVETGPSHIQPTTEAALDSAGSAEEAMGGTPDKWLPNGRPQWAQERFECLLFTVFGLKLAVPLVSLGGVHQIKEELTPLFGMPNWFVGLLSASGQNIRVVDTGLWVMPEKYSMDSRDLQRYVIRLHDSEWGLACDAINEAFTLDPEQVKWRGVRSKRPWLAGTVVEHMCALLDAEGFRILLHESAEKIRRKVN